MQYLLFSILYFFTSKISIAAVIDGQSYGNKITATEIASTVATNYQYNRPYIDDNHSGIQQIDVNNDGRNKSGKIKQDVKIQIKDPNSVADYESSDSMMLAYKAFNDGNIDIAMEYYKKSLKKSKNNIEAMFGIATCHQVLGQIADATKYYLNIIKLQPRYAPAINNLMLILAEEDLEIAIKTLQKIATHSNTDSLLWLQLGNLISQTGENHKSLRCFKLALAQEPNNPIIMYNLATTFDALNNRNSAVKFYQMSLANLQPHHAKLLNIETIKSRIKELSE